MNNAVISGWSIEGDGGPPTAWTTQLRPHLFAKNPFSFESTGYLFSNDSKEVTIILPYFYILRGLKMLGTYCML